MWQLVVGVGAIAVWAWKCTFEKNGEEDGGTVAHHDGATPSKTLDASHPVPQSMDASSYHDAGTKADAGNKPPKTMVDKFIPPQNPVFPTTETQGIFHHWFANESGRLTRDFNFPVSLSCSQMAPSCEFAMPSTNLAYSFDAHTLNNNNDISLTNTADFTPDIDGISSYLGSMLHSGNFFYGLYDSFDPSAKPGPGIAIRTASGTAQPTYLFPIADNRRMSTPSSLLAAGQGIWASASNYVGGNDIYGPGKIFALKKNADGVWNDDPSKPPLTSSQLDPQSLALWSANGKNYILAVNTGKVFTDFSTGTSQILTEAGVDVIDAQTGVIAANIPLGLGAALGIAVTADGAAAFLGSQTLHNIYAIDLEMVKTNLRTGQTQDAVVADAANPIAINAADGAFISSILFDERTRSLIATSNNDGVVLQIQADYENTPERGIDLKPGFGTVVKQFACTGEGTQQCSQAISTTSGVVALTGQPASATFIPNESLVQRQDH